MDTKSENSDFLEEVEKLFGKTGSPHTAKDAVNPTMVRHWCEAMGDYNPNYLDDDYAQKGPHKELVAPPSMLNAWTMGGIGASTQNRPEEPSSYAMNRLDEMGYAGVVATNSEHIYDRYLKMGDILSGTQKLIDVSPEKHTALGKGHFVTSETEYRDQTGEKVGSLFFRILKFIPGTGRTPEDKEENDAAPQSPDVPAKRPPPSMNANTSFFWEGAKNQELRIQQCQGCSSLSHPPLVRCPKCGSMEWGWTKVSGKAKLYSHCTVHYPRIPAFKEPPLVGLVELEEGVRLVTNITDCPKEKIDIGMDLEVWFYQDDEDVWLPLFRPARFPRNETTLKASKMKTGLELPMCPVPITATTIVACAIASRDYQDVHHDPVAARRKGSPDIFMNILTSSGIAGRYLSDWFGPEAIFKNLKIRLGAPNHPGDCMIMSGSIEGLNGNLVQVQFQGLNSLGAHITGSAELELTK